MGYLYNPSDDTVPTLLPEGEYDVRITDAWETTAKSSGRPMWVFNCKEAQTEKGLGKFYLVLDTQYTARNVADLLSACGIDAEAERELSAQEFIGKVGRARVEHDGRFHKVAWWVRRATDDAAPGTRTAPSGRKYTPPPAPKPAVAEPKAEAEEDNIPF